MTSIAAPSATQTLPAPGLPPQGLTPPSPDAPPSQAPVTGPPAVSPPSWGFPGPLLPTPYPLPAHAGFPMLPGMPNAGILGTPVYISSLSQLPVGAIPVSNHLLAQSLGQGYAGAMSAQDAPSPLRSMLAGAGIGALAGAAVGALPFLPLGLLSGAMVGAGVGAVVGLVRGMRARSKHQQQAAFLSQQAQAQAHAQMVASTPPGARSTAPAEARRGVVMGKAMRRKWALKVQAERAAAARQQR